MSGRGWLHDCVPQTSLWSRHLQCDKIVTPEAVLAVTQEQLRAVGLSNAKVRPSQPPVLLSVVARHVCAL